MRYLQPGLWVSKTTSDSSVVGGSDSHYEHVQMVPATTWSVQHNLGKYPSITIIDTSGDEVWCDVRHNSTNEITLSFSREFAGVAVCN